MLARTQVFRDELKTAEEALPEKASEEPEVTADQQATEAPEMRRIKDRKAALDTGLREQKELFLVLFQRFCIALVEHSSNANSSQQNDFWYRITLGHLKEILRKYRDEIAPFYSTIEGIWSPQLPKLKYWWSYYNLQEEHL